MIKDAVILMAGIGSRLRETKKDVPKPLIQIAGRAVCSYTIDALERAGIETVHVITGYNSDLLVAGLEQLIPAGMTLHPIHNPEWQKQNGVSVLAAKPHLRSPFLLTMGDHLFGPRIVDLVIKGADSSVLNVAVDRKLDAVFDLDDAMKLKTSGDWVISIGKDLKDYDAIDTGLFVCPAEFFEYLEQAKRADDCSLADGVRTMVADGKVRAIDIGNAWWQDIDTPAMLGAAEKALSGLGHRFTAGPAAP
ncbi:MAG TPA: NTP transferase domain-containing protein [Chthoniobacterales bacterium]|nr:NTP transferase domain-containing protein [Chthoniobacterales bacterium]